MKYKFTVVKNKKLKILCNDIYKKFKFATVSYSLIGNTTKRIFNVFVIIMVNTHNYLLLCPVLTNEQKVMPKTWS